MEITMKSKRWEIVTYGIIVVGGFALLMLFFNNTDTGSELWTKLTEGVLWLLMSTLAFFKNRLPKVLGLLKNLFSSEVLEDEADGDMDDIRQELKEMKTLLEDFTDSGSDVRARLLVKLQQMETKELEKLEDE